MNIRFAIPILFCCYLILGPANADQHHQALTGEVDPSISEMSTGGYWEKGEDYGFLRLIVQDLGWEHTRSFLHLQWLKIDEKHKQVFVLRTMSITEFNEHQWRNVQKAEYQNNCFYIHYTVRGLDGYKKAMLKSEQPGKYTITFQE